MPTITTEIKVRPFTLRAVHTHFAKSRFLKDTSGTTALEFAMVSVPFLLLFMAIAEIGLLYFATVNLENGMNVAARKVRTGELTLAAGGEAGFRNEICNNVGFFMDCDTSSLYISVDVFDQFANVSSSDPLADGDLDNDTGFNPGTAGDIVLVRIFYKWKMISPLVGDFFKTPGQNFHLITTTAAFRNEPFTGGGP